LRLFHRDGLLAGAEKAPAGGKAAGLESEPCVTAAYQIHGREDVEVVQERAPQPGHAFNLRAARDGGNKEPGGRWRQRRAADVQDRSALRWLF